MRKLIERLDTTMGTGLTEGSGGRWAVVKVYFSGAVDLPLSANYTKAQAMEIASYLNNEVGFNHTAEYRAREWDEAQQMAKRSR